MSVESDYDIIVNILKNYKKGISKLDDDEDFHSISSKEPISKVFEKIDYAITGITEAQSPSVVKHHAEVIEEAFGLAQHDLDDNLAIFEKKIGKSKKFAEETAKRKQNLEKIRKYHLG